MMRKLFLFLLLSLGLLFFTSSLSYAQSCSVTDINAGETPIFSASGFDTNHGYSIQVISNECNFNKTFCAGSDSQGNINTSLSGVNFDCNGTYQAILGEPRLGICTARDTGTNYCAPTFQVTGGQPPPPPPPECNKQCFLQNNCTPSCVGVPSDYKCRLEGRETDTCCCYPPGQFPGEVTPFDPCKNIQDPEAQEDCYRCIGQPDAPTGDSWTAIGCITTSDPQAFVAWLLARAIGIAGGIAFLLMIFAGLQIITSSGDPEKLKSGKEMLTSAIIGLIVIIFSIFLLKVIGYDILRLPGFALLE